MRRYIGLGMALVLALGVAATAFSAEPGGSKEQTKTGVVRKVDTEGKRIVVMAAQELTLGITEATKIVQGNAVMTFADIREGDTVTVAYSFDNNVASKVSIAMRALNTPAPGK